MGTDNNQYVNMREFARVDTHINLGVRLVPPEQRADLCSKIAAQALLPEFHALPDLEDSALTDWLKMLNAKLDCIVNLLTVEKDGFSTLPFVKVNLSGGGMGFNSSRSYAPGDIVELKMLLPMMPPVAMIAYGEVVAWENLSETETYGVHAQFVAIDEEIRDELIRFVFKMQREQLRERRK